MMCTSLPLQYVALQIIAGQICQTDNVHHYVRLPDRSHMRKQSPELESELFKSAQREYRNRLASALKDAKE